MKLTNRNNTTMAAVAAAALLIVVVALDETYATRIESASAHKIVSPVVPFVERRAPSAFVRRQGVGCSPAILVRGGARLSAEDDDEDEYDIDLDEDEYDSEAEEEAEIVQLSKSTVAAVAKAKSKKAEVVKKAVSASLSQTKPKKRSVSLLKALHVPYIVRACLNPFTFFSMTKAYFASLFNIDYLVEDSSQTLRSALEEKAKKAGSSGGKKPKRQFKPGQAKTLSDLPQLSA